MKRHFLVVWMLVLAALPILRCEATPLSSLRAIMSNQTAGGATNLELRFTTHDAISSGSGTMFVLFPSGFSLATIGSADISLYHGPTTGLETRETIADSASAGVWGATVSFTGVYVLALAPPTDAAIGEIPSDDIIVIRIGTADGGIHRITNPSTAGTYGLVIGGGFGGSGSIPVPISAAGTTGFSVGFTVPVPETVVVPPSTGAAVTGGGGVGAAAPPPPPPPVPVPDEPRVLHISPLTVSGVTETGAVLSWTTDRAASTRLRLEGGPASRIVDPATSGIGHTYAFSDLAPGTSYTATVEASTVDGLSAVSAPISWTTLPVVAVGNVRDFRAVRRVSDGSSVDLSWALPSGFLPGDSIVVVARADRYPSAAGDGRSVYSGSGSGAIDRPGAGEVFYAAFVKRDGRFSSGAMARVDAFVPPMPVPVPTPAPVPVPAPASPAAPAAVPLPAPTSPTGVPASSVGGASSSGGAPASEPVGGVPPVAGTEPSVPVIPTAPPVASPTVPEVGATATSVVPVAVPFDISVEWKTEDGTLTLARGEDVPTVLQEDGLQLVLGASKAIVGGQIEVDGSRYALGRSVGTGYVTAFVPADRPATVDVRIEVRSDDGQTRLLTRRIKVVAPASVVLRADRDEPAAGLDVHVFKKDGSTWRPVAGAAATLGADGAFRRYLPAGTYRLEAAKDAWRPLRQEIRLTAAGPVGGVFALGKGIENPLKAIDPQVGVLENVANVAGATAAAVVQTVEVVRTPETQAAAEVVAPAAVVATVGVTAAAASSFNVLNYLRFLLTQPMLLWRRRRRDKWGLVYHALTKQPVDLAVVRLVDAKTGAVRQTRITDAQGRFAFLAPAGSYRLEVVKPGFVFPSKLMADQTMDIDLVDLYHGEPLNAEASVTFTPNVPIDPVERTETPKSILRRQRMRTAQRLMSGASLVIAAVAVVIQPTIAMAGFAVLQVGTFVLFRRLAIPRKPKNWGIAYDEKTRKPLGRVAVRIFDKKFNKLLETQLTDKEGKYAFFAGKNVYYVTADRPGYERFVSKDLDLRQEALGVIHEPLGLRAKEAPAVSPQGAA